MTGRRMSSNVCNQKRRIKSTTPAKGVCGICGGPVSDVKVKNTAMLCFIPLWWKTHHEILCKNCEWSD
ncbi:hypothetical protein Mapa_005044 [Marchantia paleacea]|nr:hypothetical protein Mapa_005044 [Marchantia paleacea]